MRAVNLVPPEARQGGLTPGKSGGAVYGLLGGMVVLLLVLSVTAISRGERAQAEQELAQVQQSAQQYSQAADQFAQYQAAAQAASSRIDTVTNLAKARFDWAGSLREVSRLVPASTQLMGLEASVKPGVGGGGGGSQLRSALPVPAITMTGCSVDQATVADLITRLQAMRRVTNVTLERSEQKKPPEDGGGEAPGGDTAKTQPCYDVEFALVIFFTPGSAQASTEVAGVGTAATATEAAGATTPAPTPTGGN